MIDAHQHIWRIGHNDCAWPTPDLAAIHRDFGIEDLRAAAAPLGVTGSVLVQSQESDRDTDWLLGVADAEPFVLGVVGWADLKAPEAPARIEALARRPKLKGLRPMLQDKPADWILDPAARPAIAAMSRRRLVLDALVRPVHLPALAGLAQANPDLQVVVCHAGKPDIACGALDPWRSDLDRLARLSNVACKLSGLLTEAGALTGPEHLAPYVDHVLESFGPERVMWGSDWPVVNLAGTYEGWLKLAQDLTESLGSRAQAAVFGGSAARTYGLHLASAVETATVTLADQKVSQ